MLTIRKFAELANTTRRTLLFYDEQGLFKPAQVGQNGYRYYDYDQLYELTYILELRKLGLSVADIQELNRKQAANNPTALDSELNQLLTKIQAQISNLTVLKQALTTRFAQPQKSADIQLNQPVLTKLPVNYFWRSVLSVDCSEKAIAETYADFYQKMGYLKLIDKHESGYQTILPNCDPNLYPDAVFSILKQTKCTTATAQLPLVVRPAGQYISVDTTNDEKAMYVALQILRTHIQQQHIKINDKLWQMNLNERLTSMGGSHYIRLQYQVLS